MQELQRLLVPSVAVAIMMPCLVVAETCLIAMLSMVHIAALVNSMGSPCTVRVVNLIAKTPAEVYAFPVTPADVYKKD